MRLVIGGGVLTDEDGCGRSRDVAEGFDMAYHFVLRI